MKNLKEEIQWSKKLMGLSEGLNLFKSNNNEKYFDSTTHKEFPYYEIDRHPLWYKFEYNKLGDLTYYEDYTGEWLKVEYDNERNIIYREDSYGRIERSGDGSLDEGLNLFKKRETVDGYSWRGWTEDDIIWFIKRYENQVNGVAVKNVFNINVVSDNKLIADIEGYINEDETIIDRNVPYYYKKMEREVYGINEGLNLFKKPQPKYASLLYRDGNNYKYYFNVPLSSEIFYRLQLDDDGNINQLKNNEFEIEEFGIAPDEIYDFLDIDYDEDSDHNLVDVIELHDDLDPEMDWPLLDNGNDQPEYINEGLNLQKKQFIYHDWDTDEDFPESEVDKHSEWTKYEYDKRGRVVYYEDNYGNSIKREYDLRGNIIYVENSSGYWQRNKYDERGNQIYYEDSNGDWVKKEFNKDGISIDRRNEQLDEGLNLPKKKNQVKYFDMSNYPIDPTQLKNYKDWYRREYDDAGNIIFSENNNGTWLKWEYDDRKNIIYFEDSTGYWEQTKYDKFGYKIGQKNSKGEWEKREYDNFGNLLYYEDSEGTIEDYRSDPINEGLNLFKKRKLTYQEIYDENNFLVYYEDSNGDSSDNTEEFINEDDNNEINEDYNEDLNNEITEYYNENLYNEKKGFKLTNKQVLETEIDEATSIGSVGSGGQGTGFAYIDPYGKGYHKDKNWGTWAKNEESMRWGKKTVWPGGTFVKVKEKCKKFPYCNQGNAGALVYSNPKSAGEHVVKEGLNLMKKEYIVKWLEFPTGNRSYGGGGWSKRAKYKPKPELITIKTSHIKFQGKSVIVNGNRKLKLNIYELDGTPIREDYYNIRFDTENISEGLNLFKKSRTEYKISVMVEEDNGNGSYDYVFEDSFMVSSQDLQQLMTICTEQLYLVHNDDSTIYIYDDVNNGVIIYNIFIAIDEPKEDQNDEEHYLEGSDPYGFLDRGAAINNATGIIQKIKNLNNTKFEFNRT